MQHVLLYIIFTLSEALTCLVVWKQPVWPWCCKKHSNLTLQNTLRQINSVFNILPSQKSNMSCSMKSTWIICLKTCTLCICSVSARTGNLILFYGPVVLGPRFGEWGLNANAILKENSSRQFKLNKTEKTVCWMHFSKIRTLCPEAAFYPSGL